MSRWLRFLAPALAIVAVACGNGAAPEARREQKQEQLALLTSLPLVFSEDFSLEAPKHPLMASLERQYRVTSVDGPEQLERGGLLLAVQPQALTAERLVALDRWVREGGRALLFADPRFTWESTRPLGDKFRPPFAFSDTGLLRRWGLTLTAGEDGPVLRQLGGREVETGSPGVLAAEPGATCEVSRDGLVARCRIGRGRAVIVADADLIQAGQAGGLDGPTEANLPGIMAELAAL